MNGRSYSLWDDEFTGSTNLPLHNSWVTMTLTENSHLRLVISQSVQSNLPVQPIQLVCATILWITQGQIRKTNYWCGSDMSNRHLEISSHHTFKRQIIQRWHIEEKWFEQIQWKMWLETKQLRDKNINRNE